MSGTTPFDCPRCGVSLTMSERQGIEIDYCPQCRGVWLDRGELDKVIERSAANPVSTSQAQPNAPSQGQFLAPGAHQSSGPWSSSGYPTSPGEHEDRHGGYDKHGRSGHRRKSFLSDLFD